MVDIIPSVIHSNCLICRSKASRLDVMAEYSKRHGDKELLNLVVIGKVMFVDVKIMLKHVLLKSMLYINTNSN